MKNILVIAMALITLQGIAQEKRALANRMDRPHRMSDLSPEQAATLKTKKMTLHLDLTTKQQDEIYKLNLENAKARKEMMANLKAKREHGELKKPTQEQRYKMMNARLDHQIDEKAKMKTILNSEQFIKWENHQKKMQQQGRKMKRHMAHKPSEAPKNRK
ncbi:hypothetical protein [Aestuariibaculum sediminum]|uniref:LTXXQ motif family protein n=1 Tax=Aestuariibaculum sediminum TaxID=2770637 RepID=A0A8J6QMD0_9FLAO|nr:hypothetical protein [Aestuariibaculum sediminum]MBD0833619.1 hypothetical protein [Aestuariibaculum sediminum]